MSKQLNKLSKQLSYYLRHKPEDIGLTMDRDGWVEIEQLLQKWPMGALTLSDLQEIVRTDEKGRYAFHTTRGPNGPGPAMVRAVQGHSTVVADVTFPEVVPPALLFHGTVERFLPHIKAEGLLPQTRHYVHLSGEMETAEQVGNRRGDAIILIVRAAEMHEAGYKFFYAENGVYLADEVPAKFINFPD